MRAPLILPFMDGRTVDVAMSVAQLAELVSGTVVGDGSRLIHSALPIAEATPDSITFCTDRKHADKLTKSRAGAVVLGKGIIYAELPAIVVADPLTAIIKIAQKLDTVEIEKTTGIDPRAAVDASAKIGANTSIGPFAVIEADVELGPNCIIHAHAVIRRGCRIGEGVEIHPHVVLYPKTMVGDRTIIHSGVVLGGDGFGYKFTDGAHRKIPHLGRLEIAADVEIGPNSTIDRAMLGSTRIGEGTKIDNLVQIAHNCQIGKHNIFVAGVGMAGSCVTGDGAVFAGQVGVGDHVHVGAGATLCARSGAFQDVPAGEVYLGEPARPQREWKRMYLLTEKLPEMRAELSAIRRHLGLDRKSFSTAESVNGKAEGSP